MIAPGLLTPRETVVFDAIKRAARAGEVCPSNLDLSALLDCESVATPTRYLKMLEKKGVVRVKRYQQGRTVSIVGTDLATREPASRTMHWRNRPKLTRAQWMDMLAEEVADGKSLRAAAEAIGRNYSWVCELWREICAQLGSQAV